MRITNRRAYHDYHILETFEAGIVLTGAEVKSLRANRADLSQAFAKIQNGEVFLKNAYIYPYHGQDPSYDPKHDRKLLMHKKEIMYLIGKTQGSAQTIIPLEIYTAHNFFKVKLALAASKKKFDKKQAIKKRDEQRRIEQEI